MTPIIIDTSILPLPGSIYAKLAVGIEQITKNRYLPKCIINHHSKAYKKYYQIYSFKAKGDIFQPDRYPTTPSPTHHCPFVHSIKSFLMSLISLGILTDRRNS